MVWGVCGVWVLYVYVCAVWVQGVCVGACGGWVWGVCVCVHKKVSSGLAAVGLTSSTSPLSGQGSTLYIWETQILLIEMKGNNTQKKRSFI